MALSDLELLRYQRQLVIPQVGLEGQRKLKQAHVLIVGIGGLGSISASYLAAAGVGRITIVDSDRVELGNLNRQLLHWTDDVGRWKTDSASVKLKLLNPHCRITSIHERITIHNIELFLSDCCIMLDATDNIITRYVLNEVSLRRKIPFVCGGVSEFSGMLTTFIPGETPCFECVFPKTTVKSKPNGVLGPAPGVVAAMQTMEAIKWILNVGEIMRGKILKFSLFSMIFKEVMIERNPHCQRCGNKEEA